MDKSAVYFVISILLSMVSCEDHQDCCLPMDSLIGTWQVYETGYSPGGGYIVEEVPDEPAQIMEFKSDHQFWSNRQGLDDYSYYLILEDNSKGSILALYKNELDAENNQEIHSLSHIYVSVFKEGKVKLSFRDCVEGCHIGLKKLE
ncbi:MAG: hypothetical protein RIG62_22950 [Cyclobacteriaceae bacterium]